MPINEISPARLGKLTMWVGVLLLVTGIVAIAMTQRLSFGVLSSFGVGILLISQGVFQMHVLRHVA